MTNTSKNDNSHMNPKLELRRHFLTKYHGKQDPARVLDCCQGEARLWTTLRREYKLESYLGLDMKHKRGRLRLDSTRFLAQPEWPQNVVDIDTYGSPWKHYRAMLPNVRGAVTVFLTIGQVLMGTDRIILETLGLQRLRLPAGIACKLHDLALTYCLAEACGFGIIISEAVEALPSGNARYIGLRLEKANGPGAGHAEPALDKRNAGKERAHARKTSSHSEPRGGIPSATARRPARSRVDRPPAGNLPDEPTQ